MLFGMLARMVWRIETHGFWNCASGCSYWNSFLRRIQRGNKVENTQDTDLKVDVSRHGVW